MKQAISMKSTDNSWSTFPESVGPETPKCLWTAVPFLLRYSCKDDFVVLPTRNTPLSVAHRKCGPSPPLSPIAATRSGGIP